MKVTLLDADHFLTQLSVPEASLLGLLRLQEDGGLPQLAFSSFRARLAAAKILSLVCARYRFRCQHKKISVRAVTCTEESILLLFSAQYGKRFRIKTPCPDVVFRLQSAEDLFVCMERLRHFPAVPTCKLFSCGEQFYLLLTPTRRQKPSLLTVLSEYGQPCGSGPTCTAFLWEHCRLLSVDAVKEIGGVL